MLKNREDIEYNFIERLSQIMKYVKEREQHYLELLSFIKKNINSSSQEINQVTIFSMFLKNNQKKILQLTQQEQTLLEQFQDNNDNIIRTISIKKELNRLCARLVEIIDFSLIRAKDSIVYGNYVKSEHSKFKRELKILIESDEISLVDLLKLLWEYLRNKYFFQLNKIQLYTINLESGQNISLKQFYESINQKNQQSYNLSLNKSKQKSKKKNQKNQTPKNREKQQKINNEFIDVLEQQNKQKIINRYLKNYNILDISKKQFLQDTLYNKNQYHEQSRKIFYNLWEKNKFNSQQIKKYQKRIDTVPNLQLRLQEKTKEFQEKRKEEKNLNTKSLIGVRNSFIISRIKQRNDKSVSINVRSGRNSVLSDVEISSFNMLMTIPVQSLIPQEETCISDRIIMEKSNRFGTRSKKSNKLQETPKKIYIIKNAIIFDDEILQSDQTVKIKKYQPLKIKKKNQKLSLNKNQLSLYTTSMKKNYYY